MFRNATLVHPVPPHVPGDKSDWLLLIVSLISDFATASLSSISCEDGQEVSCLPPDMTTGEDIAGDSQLLCCGEVRGHSRKKKEMK